MSALHNKYRALHIPGPSADFDAIFKGVISSRYGIEKSRFRFGSVAHSIRALRIVGINCLWLGKPAVQAFATSSDMYVLC
jgi:hypothetical protein